MKIHAGFMKALCREKFFFVIFAVSSLPAFSQGKAITITGEVIAVKEDLQVNPGKIAITVETKDDYDNYYITLNVKGKELISQVYNTVEVMCTVQLKSGEKWITVKNWKLIAKPEGNEDLIPMGEDVGNSDVYKY